MLSALEEAVNAGDAEGVQDAIFNLGRMRDGHGMIPDEVALALLAFLRNEALADSQLTGHILNFFEFESKLISPGAKETCRGFVQAWGDRFTDVHAIQVIAELMSGKYLR